jgi:hypothetical protein
MLCIPHTPAEALVAPLAAQAAIFSGLHAPEAAMALHCSALIGQEPEAAQAPLAAEAAVAVVVACEAHPAWAADELADFIPHDPALAAGVFAASPAKAALAHHAVAAMARARSLNSFMSDLPEGGAEPAGPAIDA